MASVELLAYALVLAAILSAIALIDARIQRIPDPLNLVLLLSGLVFRMRSNSEELTIQVAFAVAVALLFVAVRQIHGAFAGVVGLGLGDVKMAGAGALWVCPCHFHLFLLVATSTSLGFMLLTSIRRRSMDRSRRVPFGPFLALGIATAFAVEEFR